jgi:hypothetical protein
MSVCGAAQWVKISERWPKFKSFNFHKILKNLLEGTCKKRALLVAAVPKGTLYTKSGSGLLIIFTVTN